MTMDWLKKVTTSDFTLSSVDGIYFPLLLIIFIFGLGIRYVYKKHNARLDHIDRRTYK